jgi:peptide/nickel transport system ATP-binding protein
MSIAVSDLRVDIAGNPILSGIDFSLDGNISVGVVGESGSGKTTFVRALMGLLPKEGVATGSYLLDEEEVDLNGREKVWIKIRGTKLGLIMQDPFTSLDPFVKCGRQIVAGLARPRAKAFDIAGALNEVGLAEAVAEKYPFELSGGMRQRVVIAAALATEPEILIADEATSALDVLTQKDILDLIGRIHKDRAMPLIIITHDLRIVKERTDRIMVFHDGQVIEVGDTAEVLADPRQDYTRALLAAGIPVPTSPAPQPSHPKKILLRAADLSKKFGDHIAMQDVSIDIYENECIAVVGESGSGKTTLARTIIGLARPDSGSIRFDGNADGTGIQIVFQDPYSSLNPALKIHTILAEALKTAGRAAGEVESLLALVELPADFALRKPAELSGGQRQRVAIARALATKPKLLICDESVSALDVLIQAKILELLRKLREKENFSILFISHDMDVVRRIADRLYVMQYGRVVESGDAEDIFENPQDPYTIRLLNI